MLFETDKKDFFDNYFKSTGVVLTTVIAEYNKFNGKIYIDDKNRYYISTVIGDDKFITAFQPYSIDLFNEIVNEFPNVLYVEFIYDGYISKESINREHVFSYNYKFQGKLNPEIITEQPFTVKLINESNIKLAEQYDDLYKNSLPPHHRARLATHFKYSVESGKDKENKIYIAFVDDIPIGFILAYYHPEYLTWRFSHIEIAENYRQKGYGAAFLTEVTKDNMKPEYSLYYTGVSGTNIASRKTAEKAGYTIVTSMIYVKTK